MSAELIWRNCLNYALQMAILVTIAAGVPLLLRLRSDARLAFWRLTLAAVLLLPAISPWRHPPVQIVTADHMSAGLAMQGVAPVDNGTAAAPALSVAMIGLTLLALGFVASLLFLLTGLRRLRRLRQRSTPLLPASAWRVEADLRLSADVNGPVTFGVLHPVVLLPAGFPELDPVQQEAILCHEVVHIRRRDWLFALAEEALRCIFWFHPAMWWLLSEIQLAREQVVDREAIDITGRQEQYMDALVGFASGIHPGAHFNPAPAFLRRRHLSKRVAAILSEKHVSNARWISTFAVGLAMLAILCVMAPAAAPLIASPQVHTDAAVNIVVGGPHLKYSTDIVYPDDAMNKGVEGSVSVMAQIDSDGQVVDARVVGGPLELRKAVLERVLQWRFEKTGRADTSSITVIFRLPTRTANRFQAVNYPGHIHAMSDRVLPPALLVKVDPELTPEARGSHLAGAVTLSCVVNLNGRCEDIRLIQGLGMGLDEKAIEAAAKWRFRPGTLHGMSVSVRAQLEVNFDAQ